MGWDSRSRGTREGASGSVTSGAEGRPAAGPGRACRLPCGPPPEQDSSRRTETAGNSLLPTWATAANRQAGGSAAATGGPARQPEARPPVGDERVQLDGTRELPGDRPLGAAEGAHHGVMDKKQGSGRTDQATLQGDVSEPTAQTENVT